MSLHHRRQFFGPSCPSGGKFYACNQGSNFVGCCNVEPCGQGCADGSLEPASFNIAYYSQFPDQQCPRGSRWFTCTATTPPFMGCCKSNPCAQNGCPVGDLTAGFLDSNPNNAAPFLSSGSSSSQTTSFLSTSSATHSSASASTNLSSPTITASTSSANHSSASTSTNLASPTITASTSTTAAAETASASGAHTTNPAAIAGGVVGGIAVITITIAALIVYRWKSKKAPPGGGGTQHGSAASDFKTQEKNGSSGKSATDLQTASINVHEAQDPYVSSNGINGPKYHGQSYPSPTPAYSPGEHNSQSPPGYPTISELDTPKTQPQNFHHIPHQPVELSTPRSPSSPSSYLPYRRPENSSDGLGIAVSASSNSSPFNQTFPSPLHTASEAHKAAGRISGSNLRGDRISAAGSSELSAVDSVRVPRKPMAPLGADRLPYPSPMSEI